MPHPVVIHLTPFYFTPIYPQQTQYLLQHLNIQKSTGPDGLSSRFIREAASEIAEPLTKLYNISKQSDCIPLEWKHCNVTAVHKAGPQDDPSIYCPILVVSVIAKSTEKILLYAVDTIVNALDCGKIVCTAF